MSQSSKDISLIGIRREHTVGDHKHRCTDVIRDNPLAAEIAGELRSDRHKRLEDVRLEDIRLGSDFYDVLNWKNNYKTITVKRRAKVGDEDVWVVEKRGEKGGRRHADTGERDGDGGRH